MSVSSPPHVELIREETVKTLSATSTTRSSAMKPHDLHLLAEGEEVGLRRRNAGSDHIFPVMPTPDCTSSKMSNTSFSSHSWLHRLQELGTEVVVAAFALDRLDDERGDVVRVLREGTAWPARARPARAASTSASDSP